MKAATLYLLTLLMILIWTNEIYAQSWDFVYDGERLPSANEWEVFITNGTDVSDVCEITPDGALFIDDPADKVCFFLPEVDGVEVGTIEARVKVLAQSGANYTILFGIEDAAVDAWINLFTDHIEVDGGGTHDVDMTDYHTLRLAKDVTEFILYVDDEEVLDGTLPATTDRQGTIIFGSGSTGGIGEHYWDYVVYTAEGAFSPEELPNYPSTLVVDSKDKMATCWANIKL